METARRAKDKGQFDKAIREYLKVVGEDPKDVRVWLKIGDLYALKGAKSEATDTYTKVARFYSEQGFYLKSVAVYKQILKLDPRLVEVNLKLAELYRQLGLLSDAMQHFEMVAAFFHREGKTREALATLRQLVELDPDNVATRIKLAELYSKEQMNEEAVAEFGQACDFLRNNNRIDDFVKVAERLLFHNQQDIPLNKELATLYLHRRDPRRALQKLQVCFKADGRDVDTLALLAQAFQALDQRGKTVSVLKELARILVDSGKRNQADEVHHKILSFVPDDPDSLEFLGMSQPAAPAIPAPAPAPGISGLPYSEPASQYPASAMEVADDMIVDEPEISNYDARPGLEAGKRTGSFPLVRPSDQDEFDYRPPSSFGADASFGDTNQHSDQPSDGSFAEFDFVDEPSYHSSVRGEANADEIVKILTETDVYVKYGLHQKAIEHLHRVFELDPENIEARERLKDIFLSLSREREAISQLVHLATVMGPREPERASGYIRAIFDLDPTHAEAKRLVTRFRLDLSGASAPTVDEGALDFGQHDSLSFGNSNQGSSDPAIGYASSSPSGSPLPTAEAQLGFNTPISRPGNPASIPATDYSEFGADPTPVQDTGELTLAGYSDSTGQVHSISQPVQTAPLTLDPMDSVAAIDPMLPVAGSNPPVAEFHPPTDSAALDSAGSFDFEFDLGSEHSFDEPLTTADPTGVSHAIDEANQAQGRDDSDVYALSDDDIILEDEGPIPGFASANEGVTREVSMEQVEAKVALARAGADIDFEDLSFEAAPPVEAVPFESAPKTTAMELPPDGSSFSSQIAAISTNEIAPAGRAPSEIGSIDSIVPPLSTADVALKDALAVEEEFAAGNTISEAERQTRAVAQHDDVTVDVPLDALEAAIAAKRAEPRESAPPSLEDDLDEADFFMSQGLFDEASEILSAAGARHPNHQLIAEKLAELAALEGQGSDLSAPHDPTIHSKPSVLLEKPVDDEDADTHFDLGLAYKEMGLHEEAIKAFTKVIHVAGRAVQCYLMLGLCHRETGDQSEAINKFKAGLYVDQISTAEKYGLYYEIGSSYESVDDPAEALYYYEMIIKKQPDYRDVSERVAGLRARHPAAKGAV